MASSEIQVQLAIAKGHCTLSLRSLGLTVRLCTGACEGEWPLRSFKEPDSLVDSCSLHFDSPPVPLNTQPIPSRGPLLPVTTSSIPSFLRFLHLACMRPIYTYSFLISTVSYTREPYRTSASTPRAFHEHVTTVHAVYLCCILHPFSTSPVPSLISYHRHCKLQHTSLPTTYVLLPPPQFSPFLFILVSHFLHVLERISYPAHSFHLCANVYVPSWALRSPSYSPVFT